MVLGGKPPGGQHLHAIHLEELSVETTSRRADIGRHVSTRVPHGPGARVGAEGEEGQGQAQQMLNS